MTAHLKCWAVFPLVLTLWVILTIVPARAGGEFGGSGKFVGWWELGGFYGTDDSSRGEVVLFTPLMQSATTLFFLDARGKLFEEDVQEANIALGYRQMMTSGWNLGLWAGWDIRDTEEDNRFHQVSFGLEALSERFDLRVNGYVPVTDPKGSPGLAEVFLRGNNILMIGGEEVPLYGVDGEVGMLLFGGNRGGGGLKGAPAPAKRHELRGYVGGFWFDADEALEEVAGPKGRLEYRINDVVSSLPGSRLTLESELSYDEVRDTKFEIGARLRIPFGARGGDALSRHAALTGQELRMIEGLERDTDIVTAQSKEENVIDDATNVAMNAVSFASNAAGFASAVNQGGNRLIILQDGGAQIDVSATDGQALQNNQTVQGGASTLNYRGAKSGTVAAFKAPGARPTLFSSDTNFLTGMITVNNNTHVAGLNFRGVGDPLTFVSGNNGVVGPTGGSGNVVIEQSHFSNIGSVGAKFASGMSNVRVANNVFTQSRSDAVAFQNDNRNISIWGNTITNLGPAANGLFFGDRNQNVMVSHNIFDGIGNNAIFLRDQNRDVSLSHNTISNVDIGILVRDMNENFTIAHTDIANTGDNAIQIESNNSTFTFSDLNIRNAGSDGVAFRDMNTNLTLQRLTITDPGRRGIEGERENNKITIANVTITNPDGEGIDLARDNMNVLIKDTTITGGAQLMPDGIFLSSGTHADIIGVRITNSQNEGIDLSSDHVVTIRDTIITGGPAVMIDGIEMTGDNVVTIENVTINGKGATGVGIEMFGANNNVTISNVTISDMDMGLEANNSGSTISMNNTTFSGAFTNNVVELVGGPNNLSGSGNVFNGSTVGVFCNSVAQNGSFTFVTPAATCP